MLNFLFHHGYVTYEFCDDGQFNYVMHKFKQMMKKIFSNVNENQAKKLKLKFK